MVALVRCTDGTFTLALESRLDELIESGLIEALLRDNRWVDIENRQAIGKNVACGAGLLMTAGASQY